MKRHRRDFYNAELLDEACSISNDLGRVIFIGAVAIYLHTDGELERRTRDFDCSIAYEVSDEWLESKRYIKNPNTRNEYRTPRDKKLDIYKGDLSGIPFGTIIERPEVFDIHSRKVSVAAVKLEVLMLMKMRAKTCRRSLIPSRNQKTHFNTLFGWPFNRHTYFIILARLQSIHLISQSRKCF